MDRVCTEQISGEVELQSGPASEETVTLTVEPVSVEDVNSGITLKPEEIETIEQMSAGFTLKPEVESTISIVEDTATAEGVAEGVVTPVPIECACEDVKVQPIIILQTQNIQGGAELVKNEAIEPPTKRLCVESLNGQTYVVNVSVPGLDGNAVAAMQDTHPEFHAALHDPKQNVDVTQAWFTSRDDKTALTSKGQQWKQGQWSKEEVDLLQTNITNYCKVNGINDPTEIIFEMSKDERKDFYRTVAKGLQRPLFSVYRRVIRMYDQKNHIGKYTPEEIENLKELRARYGTDWATIGSAMGRSASSVKDRCRLMKDTCNTGKWLPEEERRLTSAVYEQSQARPGEGVTQGISWAAVAEKVMTRSEKQCRTKWLNYLNWKEKGGSDWTREDDFALIDKLARTGATDETQIDWVELCKGWESVRSPQWLRGKWWNMKKHVQDYQLMPFQEIIQWLKHMEENCIRGKMTVGSPAVRLRMTRNDMQKYGMVPGLAVHVNDHEGLGETSSATTIIPSTSEEDVASNNLQYEILTQQLTPVSSGAYLITQPQNNPAISFTTANMATDHIIVHTLPINQLTDTLPSNENVTVQMNPENQVIVSSGHDIHGESIDLHALAQSGIGHTAGTVVHSVDDNYVKQDIVTPAMVEHVNQPELDPTPVGEAVDMVLVATGSPHYAQSTSSNDGDLIHLSSLADPMLPTDSGDLVTSDVETEKVQAHDVEDS